VQRLSFALTTFVVLIVLAAPIVVFSTLKYRGLSDISVGVQSEADTAADYQPEPSGCILRLKIDSSQKDFADGNPCGVLLCEGGICAGHLEYDSGADIFAAQPQVGQRAEAAYAELTSSEPEDEQPADDGTEVAQGPYDYPLWQWLSIFSVAVTFSTIGVASSLAARNRTILGLRLDGSVASIFVVYFFSALSGVLIVCIFASGIIQGQLFPSFSGDVENFGFNSWSALKFRGTDWFKLALWAYVSGFYERFLPDMLDRIVKRSQDEGEEGRAEPPSEISTTTSS
jgi:hypothetical protein